MRNPLFSCIALLAVCFFAFAPSRPDRFPPGPSDPFTPLYSDPVTPGHADPFTTIRTRDGLLSGTTNKDGSVHIFRGIPFAAPPIGARRWRAPQPPTPWKGIRKCDSFGPSPMQPKPVPFGVYTSEFLIPEQPISEDCLYLNVWTAAKTPIERRPVLVYIYGGGFVSGGSACPIYDGEAIAKKGVIFVTISYRVGIFGFFSHPGLTAESGHQASGNYGLLDQMAALRWVKENVAAFGGDPSNVTIAGQSAGSMSVSCLIASPLAKGLFERAIGESGASLVAGTGFLQTPTLQQAEQEGLKVAANLHANDIAALRAIPAERLLTVNTQRAPIIDGYVLPAAPGDIFRAHRYNRCDLLTGWNEDDWFLFGPVKNAQQFRQQLQQIFGAKSDSAQIFYPATDDATALTSQERLIRDLLIGVQNYTWANIQAGTPAAANGLSTASGEQPSAANERPAATGMHPAAVHNRVFLYRFRRRLPATGDFVKYGAFHTGEVPYAYDNLAYTNRPWEPVDHQLAAIMSSYWVNFARTGDPNGPGLPVWPRYVLPDAQAMILDEQSHAAPLPDKPMLDFILRRIAKSNPSN